MYFDPVRKKMISNEQTKATSTYKIKPIHFVVKNVEISLTRIRKNISAGTGGNGFFTDLQKTMLKNSENRNLPATTNITADKGALPACY